MKKLIFMVIFILIPCLVSAGILEVIARKRVVAGGSSTLTAFLQGDETNGASLSTGSGTVSLTSITYGDNCDSSDASGAFVLDADSDSIQIQTSGNIDYSVGRIEMNVTPVGTQTLHQFQALLGDTTNYHVFTLVHEADNTLRFRTSNGSIYWTAATSTALLAADTCYAIILTWDFTNDTVSLSIDGTAATIDTSDGRSATLDFAAPTTGTNFMIGSSSNTFSYRGRIDSVSIYSTASGL